MEEPTNLEILKEFAKSTGRQIFNEEIIYPSSGGIRNYQKSRQTIYIPYDNSNTNFFIWYSDPFTRGGIPTDFCGAFIPISSQTKAELNIRKKYFIDKLNIFSDSKSNIGSRDFRSKVIMKGDINNTEIIKLLSHSRAQGQILKVLDMEMLINISINEFNIDFIPELKNKAYLSIINPQSWCTEKKDIEDIFKQMELLRSFI